MAQVVAVCSLLLLCCSCACGISHTYTAAVLEHARFQGWDHSPHWIVTQNLAVYRNAAQVAASKGADILVFPEYGIFPIGTRKQMKPCMENIPDIKQTAIRPCDYPREYSNRPILYFLSCLAKNNSLVIVANMGDIQDCKNRSDCRQDKLLFFNTNVVFGRDGRLLLKYHKETSFNESAMDLPQNPQFPVFETDFGKFITYTCFDIQWKNAVDVFQMTKADGLALPSMWDEEPPQTTSLQIFESWSIANNATLLAANGNVPGNGAVGSGIFNGWVGTIAYTYNPDGFSKLVVAKVPKYAYPLKFPSSSITIIKADESWPWVNDGKDVTRECSELVLGPYKDIHKDYRCFQEHTSNYLFTQLKNASGSVKACNNGMCCTLEYTSIGLKDYFYLGIHNGTQNSFNSTYWCEENCVLTVCESLGNISCAVFPRRTQTIFTKIHLKANFTSEVVYPSIVESGMRLIPKKEKNIKINNDSEKRAELLFANKRGRKIISASLDGRCYNRDSKK